MRLCKVPYLRIAGLAGVFGKARLSRVICRGLRSEQFGDAVGDLVCGFCQEGSVEMGVALGAFGGAVAQEFAGHEQRFAGHDGMRGVGVAEIVEPERWGEPGLALEDRPSPINIFAGLSGIAGTWEDKSRRWVTVQSVYDLARRITQIDDAGPCFRLTQS